MMKGSIWLEHPELSGYRFSPEGDVYSLHINRVLNPCTNKGYKRLTFYVNKTRKQKFVHRMIADIYCKKPNDKCQVNHIDGNKLNNHYKNLEWVTCSENLKHAFRLGLKKGQRGEESPVAKLTEKKVLKIKELLSAGKLEQKEIGKMFGISQQHISDIKTKRRWAHLSARGD